MFCLLEKSLRRLHPRNWGRSQRDRSTGKRRRPWVSIHPPTIILWLEIILPSNVPPPHLKDRIMITACPPPATFLKILISCCFPPLFLGPKIPLPVTKSHPPPCVGLCLRLHVRLCLLLNYRGTWVAIVSSWLVQCQGTACASWRSWIPDCSSWKKRWTVWWQCSDRHPLRVKHLNLFKKVSMSTRDRRALFSMVSYSFLSITIWERRMTVTDRCFSFSCLFCRKYCWRLLQVSPGAWKER